MKKRNIGLLVGAVLAATLGLSQADSHDEARRLTESQQIIPLEDLLSKVRQDYPGKVLEVELEHEYGGYRYEIEMLDAEGRVMELKYDAKSGELLKQGHDD